MFHLDRRFVVQSLVSSLTILEHFYELEYNRVKGSEPI